MQINFSPAIERAHDMLNTAISAVPSIVAALLLLGVFYLIARVLGSFARKQAERREARSNAARVIGRIAQALVILLGLLFAASVAFPNFKPADVVQILGIGGVAIGFAFKDILQNFLAGILLLLTHPFRIGDEIVTGEYEGVVEDIQTRATFLRTYDGRRVVIPNGELFTSKVIVNTAFNERRVEVEIGVGYGDDLEQARRLLVDALKSLPETLEKPAPDVIIREFADSWVTLRLRWWIRPPKFSDLLESRDKVLAAVKTTLASNGIDLPFPTQQILFHDQTEETDGDRTRQREGWPSANGSAPKPRRIVDAIQEAANAPRDTDQR